MSQTPQTQAQLAQTPPRDPPKTAVSDGYGDEPRELAHRIAALTKDEVEQLALYLKDKI